RRSSGAPLLRTASGRPRRVSRRTPCSASCVVFLRTRRPPCSPLFPYTTLFRSHDGARRPAHAGPDGARIAVARRDRGPERVRARSEEHTSELQSLTNLVCRLLLEKKKLALPSVRHGHAEPKHSRGRLRDHAMRQ